VRHKNYDRSVPLNCPTCGGTDFSGADELLTCTGCSLEISREDLVQRNAENIQAHVAELKQEVTADLQKQLKKTLADALRGNKHIKIR